MENQWLHHLTVYRNFYWKWKITLSKPQNFLRSGSFKIWNIVFLSNDSFKQIYMVLFRGVSINNEAMSWIGIKQPELYWSIFLAKPKESLRLHSFYVKFLSTRTGNLSILYVSVLVAERISRKGGQPSANLLWTYAKPQRNPEGLPYGHNLWFRSSLI